MVVDIKNLSVAHKKIDKKHHRVRGILVEALLHSKYTKIVDISTTKRTFEPLCSTYEGNQQVKETKANILVQQ